MITKKVPDPYICDVNQTRSHNLVNEITGITVADTNQPQWADPNCDARGNMTDVPKPTDLANSYTCSYDAWNRLVEIKSGETVVARYEYDAMNRRVKKHIDTQAPGSPNGVDAYSHFYYNAAWQVLETRQSASENTEPETLQPEYQYVWSLRYIDSPVLRNKNTDTDNDCDDETIYYMTDGNFNITGLLGTGGAVLERYVYDPYGNLTIYDDDWSETRSTSSYDNAVLFCGYYRDRETGLYHVRHRYYHPTLGRWLQRDLKSYIQTANLYEYCIGSPLNHVDWLGAQSSSTTQGQLRPYIPKPVTPTEDPTARRVRCRNEYDQDIQHCVNMQNSTGGRSVACCDEAYRHRINNQDVAGCEDYFDCLDDAEEDYKECLGKNDKPEFIDCNEILHNCLGICIDGCPLTGPFLPVCIKWCGISCTALYVSCQAMNLLIHTQR